MKENIADSWAWRVGNGMESLYLGSFIFKNRPFYVTPYTVENASFLLKSLNDPFKSRGDK